MHQNNSKCTKFKQLNQPRSTTNTNSKNKRKECKEETNTIKPLVASNTCKQTKKPQTT